MREMTFTISLTPSRSPGKVTATSSDGHTFTTSMCLLDGARYWQARGAPFTASIVTIWSSGPGHWALRSTIGHAAKLTVRKASAIAPTSPSGRPSPATRRRGIHHRVDHRRVISRRPHPHSPQTNNRLQQRRVTCRGEN
jgi:hypothetical protein